MRLPKLLQLVLFEESRKVCFGLWLFITATVLRMKGLIDSDSWMMCAVLSSALIGGGTVADRFMALKKGDAHAPSPAPAA